MECSDINNSDSLFILLKQPSYAHIITAVDIDEDANASQCQDSVAAVSPPRVGRLVDETVAAVALIDINREIFGEAAKKSREEIESLALDSGACGS